MRFFYRVNFQPKIQNQAHITDTFLDLESAEIYAFIRDDKSNAACVEPDDLSATIDTAGVPLWKRGSKGDFNTSTKNNLRSQILPVPPFQKEGTYFDCPAERIACGDT